MILVIGGRSQGKAAFARQLLADAGEAGQAAWITPLADGETDSWVLAVGARCILNFHEMIRQMLSEGVDTEDVIRLMMKCPPQVITMDEVGCGIVPLDRQERQYRRLCGLAGQTLAVQADQVIRMFCGIPAYIKGEAGACPAAREPADPDGSRAETDGQA
ncbi:MAG: bifunctional adenosylcobinamide kinase/adenosylcobinamide-phosphate guanylyltransferase [Clostridiales bacterium]|nr:bifunctional adenosylcobinamide kinase/adenosylcobinamide-phosphate guanylyltransferase [Clostridiales bacterium]